MSPSDARATILVVDDNRINRSVLARRLAEAGYATIACDGGRSALAVIGDGGVDLMLLDMVMPAMSGVAVLAALRADPETRELPVIMVTARSEPQAAVEALAAGADDWIAKPFAFEALANRIGRLLARTHGQSGSSRTIGGHARLVASIQALNDQVARLSA